MEYMEFRDYRDFPGKSGCFLIFLGSRGSRRGLERFLEVVRFILTEYGPVWSHLDPIRLDFYDFRSNTFNEFLNFRCWGAFNLTRDLSKMMRIEILRRMVVRIPP